MDLIFCDSYSGEIGRPICSSGRAKNGRRDIIRCCCTIVPQRGSRCRRHLEPTTQIERKNKRKGKIEIAPEKLRKKIQTISLAKKKGEEYVTDIHLLPKNEPRLCTLYIGSILVGPETEKKIEYMELEAKTILPQVLYTLPYLLCMRSPMWR